MRSDALGLFWEDLPAAPKIKKEVIHRGPPSPVWLEDTFLPYLEESRELRGVELFTMQELATSVGARMVFDVECYKNYFLVAFKDVDSGKHWYVEAVGEHAVIDTVQLHWLMHNFQLVSFNGIYYDQPIITLALAGLNCQELKAASDRIIAGEAHTALFKVFKAKRIMLDHIDLIEVAPLSASLKKYAGRMHAKKMQDLPFAIDCVLNTDQVSIVRYYCCNDLANTESLLGVLMPELELRTEMSNQYNIDLRSKSDAQIAEHVIRHEVEKLCGHRITRPTVAEGTTFYYTLPAYMQFQTPLLKNVAKVCAETPYIVNEFGKVPVPDLIKELSIEINGTRYQMGNGGLHSCEKKRVTLASEDYEVVDADVTSYYPSIILNLGLAPSHLGAHFLTVYKSIVDRRVLAKHAGKKGEADTLKIVVNGSFGKLGSMYSCLFAPHLMITTTITGQLSLLLLIEALEMCGIHVVSANTDGIVVHLHKSKKALYKQITTWWQNATQFGLEFTHYKGLYSRDVNNYLAICTPDVNGKIKVKRKGVFVDEWRGELKAPCLRKDPSCTICVEAVENYLLNGTPLEDTVSACTDVRKFIHVGYSKSGAVKGTDYLGKVFRWYYKEGETDDIMMAESGNRIPKSVGAWPLMQLPDTVPEDVDRKWYVANAATMLKNMGVELVAA